MLRKIFLYTLVVLSAFLMLTGCYKEKHFDMPGSIDIDNQEGLDTVPFPFDATHQAGEYLIKDGIPDFARVSFMAYTDFTPELDTATWVQYDGYYGNIQYQVFYPSDEDLQFGGKNYSKQCNHVYFRPYFQTGTGKNWYLYAKMALKYLNDTQVFFWMGGREGYDKRNVAGIDFGHSFFYGAINGSPLTTLQGSWPKCPELIMPGEAFEVELACVNNLLYFKINGRTIWAFDLPAESYSMPISLHPYGNSLELYDVYIEGDYEELQQVAWRQEKGYMTIQAPALTQSENGDVLLFAEGRVKNCDQTSASNAVRSNATDIVMKRSSDGGATWGELTVVTGNQTQVNMKPEVVTAKDGTTYLFYTRDNSGRLSGDYSIYMMKSADGVTWSAPLEITTNWTDYNVTTLGGHGIQMQSGRLVIPVSCIKGGVKNVAVLYSDNGQNWQCGNMIDGETDAANANVVELTDGRVMLVLGRSLGTATDRRVSYSADGVNWSSPVSTSIEFGDVFGCRFQGATVMKPNGELVHFTPATRILGHDEKDSEFVTKPGKRIYNAPDFAGGLNVTVSGNRGETWNTPQSMFNLTGSNSFQFLSGKMDAVVLKNGAVLCVTEGGAIVPYEGLVSFKYN